MLKRRQDKQRWKQKWEVALEGEGMGTVGGGSARESKGGWSEKWRWRRLRWRWRKSAWVDQGAPCLGQDVGLRSFDFTIFCTKEMRVEIRAADNPQ